MGGRGLEMEGVGRIPYPEVECVRSGRCGVGRGLEMEGVGRIPYPEVECVRSGRFLEDVKAYRLR